MASKTNLWLQRKTQNRNEHREHENVGPTDALHDCNWLFSTDIFAEFTFEHDGTYANEMFDPINPIFIAALCNMACE